MDKDFSSLFSSLEELLRKIVEDAVAEALKRKAEELPRYPENVSVAQASEITGYTRNSLYQMHSRGTIPGAKKVGGKLLFETAVLKKWVDEGGRMI
jgi:predicted DNA-binding transcriptional regulator AlpA